VRFRLFFCVKNCLAAASATLIMAKKGPADLSDLAPRLILQGHPGSIAFHLSIYPF